MYYQLTLIALLCYCSHTQKAFEINHLRGISDRLFRSVSSLLMACGLIIVDNFVHIQHGGNACPDCELPVGSGPRGWRDRNTPSISVLSSKESEAASLIKLKVQSMLLPEWKQICISLPTDSENSLSSSLFFQLQ